MHPGELLQQAVMRAAVGGMLAMERIGSGVTFNPLDKRFGQDPYPFYRRLREKDPVHHSRLLPGPVLTRHADITAVLRDPRFGSDERKQTGYQKFRERGIKQGIIEPDEPEFTSMLRTDPPDHTRLRALVNRAFTPRTVEALRPRVEEITRRLLDDAAGLPAMDVIAVLAYPLPVIVIAEMLGVPAEDHARFKRWSDDSIRGMGFSSPEEMRIAVRARRELSAYMEGVASARRHDPKDDLISALVAVEAEGDRLSMHELVETCLLVLVAGHETTTNLIGNGLLALLRNPAELDVLRRDPDRIPQAVEELLRFDSPVQATTRIALEDLEIDGHPVAKGTQVALLLGAANRDPAQFPRPDELDVTREDVRQHLAFGHGIHFCLGAPLARIEAPIAFRQLLERYADIRLDPSWRPEFKDNLILRGLKTLPVDVTPRRSGVGKAETASAAAAATSA